MIRQRELKPDNSMKPCLPTARRMRRRHFLKGIIGGSATAVLSPLMAAESLVRSAGDTPDSYRGPNVILIRFGGGARRRESIAPETSFSPYLCRDLIKRGTLFSRMEIAQLKGLNTSHGEGTLNIVTGKYDTYKDVEGKFLGARFEPRVPTIFEYLRARFAVPEHRTLIVNGEDRPDEEFYTFSNHFAYGINYRSNMLSLYRFKAYLMRQQIEQGKLSGKDLEAKRKELAKWERVDRRTHDADRQGAQLETFWERWREFYGETGLVNPRGDRLLTELTVRAIRQLRPRLIMVNYNDCDYVHWGNLTHYTRGVAIMDEGLRQIVAAVEADEEYRANTIFVIVPDCGRDSNPYVDVPCQHHFNSRSSHEIFALLFGPGIPKQTVVDRTTDQSQIAATIGHFMGFPAAHAEQQVLTEAIA